MRQTVTMPALSDTMNVGRLSKWLKKPGDRVKKGEAIAEVETDKAVMEVEAFRDGYLSGPLAPIGVDLPLGAEIAFIVDDPSEAGGGEISTAISSAPPPPEPKHTPAAKGPSSRLAGPTTLALCEAEGCGTRHRSEQS